MQCNLLQYHTRSGRTCSATRHGPLQVKVEEQRMEQTVHQTIAAQGKNPGNLIRSVTSIRLGVDAERADEQDHEEGLADTLKEIVKRTVPSPVYAKYHEQHLQRFLSKLGAYTPRQGLPLSSSVTVHGHKVFLPQTCLLTIASSLAV